MRRNDPPLPAEPPGGGRFWEKLSPARRFVSRPDDQPGDGWTG
ncbi:MAG TPA: hypothetical protein PK971_01455 [Saprospiraceae bacterium]|nr:hypothetical protein [Saprospiraceae bacterium]HND86959.1 hypothetical protein [Saprospiraceae bacterium]